VGIRGPSRGRTLEKSKNFNKHKKGRALRKPSLVGADLFAQGPG
jgi:hypothetical protein